MNKATLKITRTPPILDILFSPSEKLSENEGNGSVQLLLLNPITAKQEKLIIKHNNPVKKIVHTDSYYYLIAGL